MSPLALQVRIYLACMHREMADDYRRIVARLRAERGMSLEDLAFEARAHAPKGTVSLSLIQKRLAPGSTAQPSPELLAALAQALDEDPNVFPEYRLARFRQLFDERTVGLDQAWENYGEFIAGLRLLATHSARELESTASTDEPTEAKDREVLSLLEARRRQNG